jgi:hypothetical protein
LSHDLDQVGWKSSTNYYFCLALHHRPLHIHLFTGLVLLAFIAQSFSRTWVVADYWLKTGYYAARCVNKSRPELHCNGKCQMMKNLRAEEKKDAESQERLSQKFDPAPLSSKHFFSDLTISTIRLGLPALPTYIAGKPSHGHVPGLLRPPLV